MEDKRKQTDTFCKRWDYAPRGRRLFWFEIHSADGIRWHESSLEIDFNSSQHNLISWIYNRLLSPKTPRSKLDLLALTLFRELTLIPEYRALFAPTDFPESYYNVLERIERINQRATELTISSFSSLTPYSKYSNSIIFYYVLENNKDNQNGDIIQTYESTRSEMERIISLSGSFSLMEGYVEVFTKSKYIIYKHLIINNCIEVYLMQSPWEKDPFFFFYTSLF